MNEQIVRVYTVKKRRKGKYKKRETKRRRKEEEERVDRARWKDSVRSVTNSGFLHATCLHDNTFDTLDSVVSRLEATFLSSVRFSFKLYVSYTALHCILSRGVPCKEGRGGCFQTESIRGANGESLAENVSRFFELHGTTSNCSRDVYESTLFHCVYPTMCIPSMFAWAFSLA